MKIRSNAVPRHKSLGNTRPNRLTRRRPGTDGTPISRIQAEGGLSRRFVSLRERIERYVDACPEAISGEQGHNTTFKVAIALIRGFDLSEIEALDFLRRYNQRCKPRWSDRELRHKLADAAQVPSRKGTMVKRHGYLLSAFRAPTSLLCMTIVRNRPTRKIQG
jgi:hypothetical protein